MPLPILQGVKVGELREDHPDISDISEDAIRRYSAGEPVQLSEDEHRIALKRLEALHQVVVPNESSSQETLVA